MDDFKEVLGKLKEDFGESIEVDMTQVLSDISPAKAGAVEDAKSRNVFSIPANMDDNKKLFDLLSGDIFNRAKINGVCSSFYLLGSCPLEMLFFMLRTKKENVYTDLYSIILDVLNSNKEEKINTTALHHIMSHWTWKDSKLTALKLVGEGVEGLSSDVEKLVTSSITDLDVLESLEFTFKNVNAEYLESHKITVGELLGVLNTPDKYGLPEVNTALIARIQKCLYSLGSSDEGHRVLFEIYRDNYLRSRAKPLLKKVVACRLKNEEITEIESIITGDYNTSCKEKMEDLLRYKSVKNKRAEQVLVKLTSDGVCNSKMTIEDNINIIKNKKNSRQTRQKAILYVGDYGTSEHIEFIESLKGEDKELDLYCAEALVSLGVENELVTVLFSCLANSKDLALVKVASNLIKKLILNRNGRTGNVANIMHELLTRIMQQPDNERTIAGINRLLNVYNALKSDDTTLTLFLAKFLATKNRVLKDRLMDYVVTHFNEIPDKYKGKVKEEIVTCSHIEYLSKKSMKCLNDISRGYLPEEV